MAELLTVGDVAKELFVSADTVRLYERKGKLRAFRTRGGQRLFIAADVERFVAERIGRQRQKPDAGASNEPRHDH